MKFTAEEFLARLPLPADEKWKNGVPFITAFKRGNVSLEFFAPRGTDFQTFHEEDEFYFIVKGSGELVIEEKRFACKTGEAFFVPANVPHHFENFTDDFATWVVFF
jgi:mannose-6-phosphate isomerase-like protein (cupin superfamily)